MSGELSLFLAMVATLLIGYGICYLETRFKRKGKTKTCSNHDWKQVMLFLNSDKAERCTLCLKCGFVLEKRVKIPLNHLQAVREGFEKHSHSIESAKALLGPKIKEKYDLMFDTQLKADLEDLSESYVPGDGIHSYLSKAITNYQELILKLRKEEGEEMFEECEKLIAKKEDL